jgi:hypothetical protein
MDIGGVPVKTLDVQARLEYARAAVAVLRALKQTDRTMRYNEFARAIGLMSHEQKWEAWHQGQVRDILNLTAAVERQAKTGEPLEFERLVNAEGEPGVGFYKSSRIVTE